MRASDFHQFTRQRPFAAFRLHASEGRVYDIRQPDSMIPLASKVIIGVGGESGVPDHAEHISMNHIVRLEQATGESADERT